MEELYKDFKKMLIYRLTDMIGLDYETMEIAIRHLIEELKEDGRKD